MLQINCGYAIRELTPNASTNYHPQLINTENLNFKNYSSLPHNEMAQYSNGISPFDSHCNKILAAFSKQWNPPQARLDYEKQFLIENWKALPPEKNSNIPFQIA